MDTEILLNEFDDFNNEENIIEPFTDNYYKLKKWLTTIGGQFDAPRENCGVKMEWINIKTQEPPFDEGILATDGKDIIACQLSKSEKGIYIRGHNFSGYECDWDCFDDYKDITHWMELPKLPSK